MHWTAAPVALALATLSVLAIRPAGNPATHLDPPSPAPGRASDTYVGVAGCAAMACHGGTRSNERNEYTTWIQKDRHARAYLTLYDDLSARIARNLGIDRPEQHPTCLACHSTGSGATHGPRFAIQDGVSCEACHGPAERYLVPHSRPDWQSLQSSAKYHTFGMANTKDIATRARICVGCHVGSPGREVNHDLIAAGHPALVFELDTFTVHMPPHWREPADPAHVRGAQAWAAGQSAALEQSLELLADRLKSGRWPELAEFDCTACHHELRTSSWRQQIGGGDRVPGRLEWSNPHWQLMRRAAPVLSKSSDGLEAIAELRRMLVRPGVAAAELAAAADRAARAATALGSQIAQVRWDAERAGALLTAATADPDAAALDHATAVQMTMAAAAVFESLRRASTTEDAASAAEARQQLNRVYDSVEDPAAFDPRQFIERLQAFRAAFDGYWTRRRAP